MRLVRLFIASSLLVAASLSLADDLKLKLNVGDPAPALKVTDWVKGTPQTLGGGNITVVEFWATWCGPCKMSIPHLTELAHKYKGKVNFVGVSVWEHAPDDYKSKVPVFVKDFGDKMDYNVATEGADTFMAKNWLTAAVENGIPSAFLVNREGKIAWIGHPMVGLDEAISSLLDNKIDYAKSRADRAKVKERELEEMKLQEKLVPIMKAFQQKDYPTVNSEADKLMAANPVARTMVAPYKILAMVQGKLDGLDKYMDSIAKDSNSYESDGLNSLVWLIVEHDLKLSPSVYKSTVKVGEKMMAKDPSNPMNMDTFALALWRAGEKSKALATQKKAVELAKTNKEVPAETVKELTDRLKMYGG